jgi:hypothetical protein
MGRWGAGKVNLMRTATAGEVPYGWSSDGTKILYQSGASIWVMSGLNRKVAHRRVRARTPFGRGSEYFEPADAGTAALTAVSGAITLPVGRRI